MARTRDNVDFLRKIWENTKTFRYGAGRGNRTPIKSLESSYSTIEPYPRMLMSEDGQGPSLLTIEPYPPTPRLRQGKPAKTSRSGETRTHGLRVPNAALYQLSHTPFLQRVSSVGEALLHN